MSTKLDAILFKTIVGCNPAIASLAGVLVPHQFVHPVNADDVDVCVAVDVGGAAPGRLDVVVQNFFLPGCPFVVGRRV